MTSGVKAQLGIVYVTVDDRSLTVSLSDGRRIELPLDWYPRLRHGSPGERNEWRLIGSGEGIHWPQLDEDLSLEGLLMGRKSAESAASVKKWLSGRKPTQRKAG